MKREFVKTCTFLIIFFLIYFYLSKVLENNEAAVRSGKFYARMTDTDIIVLGTSHALYGIDPEVMENAGINNVYNLSGYSQVVPMSYWILVNALDYCSPSIVVLDIYSIQSDAIYPSDHLSFMHSAMDAMPLSIHKMQMIENIFEDREIKKEFYFNNYLYHNRWKEIRLKDFEVLRYYLPSYHGKENGCIRDVKSVNALSPSVIDYSNQLVVSSNGMDYLKKIYDLCELKGIQLVLIQLPYNANEYQQQVGNGITIWAEEHGVLYYNMFYDTNLNIDYSVDYIEKEASHLNVMGAKKTSEALSSYLKNNVIIDR